MPAKLFSLDDIIQALEVLNVSYSYHRAYTTDNYVFASLREPVKNGIYFLEGASLPAENISGSIVITKSLESERGDLTIIAVAEPQLTFYKLMRHFYPTDIDPGVHPTAIIDPEAEVAATACIGPYCVIGKARIADRVNLRSHVVVYDDVELSADVIVESHSAIGATGVAWVWDPASQERVMQPQIGKVYIGNGTFLGTDISVVRGSVNEATYIGDHCVIAHGSKIGHGSRIGNRVHFANNVSIAGNVTVGDRSFLGSGCVVRPQVTLPSDTTVGVGAVVVKDPAEPGLVLSGVPAGPMRKKSRHTGVPKALSGE